VTPDEEGVLRRLADIDPYRVEEIIAELWNRRGWDTRVTQRSNDRGVDVFATQSTPVEQTHAIQVKRIAPSATISSADIQQYSSLQHQFNDVDAVVIVTTGRFSAAATDTAADLNVKLIDGPRLVELIEEANAYDLVGWQGGGDGHTSTAADNSTQSQVRTYDSPTDVPPVVLFALFTYQSTIRSGFDNAEAQLSDAREARDSGAYDDSIETYETAADELSEIADEVGYYASLYETLGDWGTTSFVDPSTFRSRWTTAAEAVVTELDETKEWVVQKRVLELLADDLENQVEEVEQAVKRGRTAVEDYDFDIAREAYLDAQDALPRAEQQKRLYEALSSTYNNATDQSPRNTLNTVDDLRGEVRDRLDRLDEHIDAAADMSQADLEALVGDTTLRSADEIAEQASGDVSSTRLTTTGDGSGHTPLIERIRPGERLNYIFEHSNKGVRVIETDGSERTPHHGGERYPRILLITDRRLCYIAEDGSYEHSFEYDELSGVQYKQRTGVPCIQWQRRSGTSYRFACGGVNHDLTKGTVRYIESMIESENTR
jgi:tetratricopeptide (TPR) repeat protein